MTPSLQKDGLVSGGLQPWRQYGDDPQARFVRTILCSECDLRRLHLLPPTSTPSRQSKADARISATSTSSQLTQNIEWLGQQANELSMYRGQWLLIQNNEVIAASTNIEDIRQVIIQRDIASPFVYYVPRVDEGDFTF